MRTPRQTAAPEPDSLWLRYPVRWIAQHLRRCIQIATLPPQLLLPRPKGSVSFLTACYLKRGLGRCVKSSSLFNFSNCHVEEREGGRMLLSAWLSQSKIPAEQLKIDGQLVARAGASPESMASVSQECCLVIRPDKLGLVLVCLCARDRLHRGWRAALDVSVAGLLQSSNICLGIDNSLIVDIAGLKH